MRASRTSSCSNVEAERNELSKWKESMLQVESEWDIQELALRLGGIPGRSARVEVHRCAMEILIAIQTEALDQVIRAVGKESLSVPGGTVPLATAVKTLKEERDKLAEERKVVIESKGFIVAGPSDDLSEVGKLINERHALATERDLLRESLERANAGLREAIKRDIDSDSIAGSCQCLAKTNEAKHHAPGCKYRLIVERDEARQNLNDKSIVDFVTSDASRFAKSLGLAWPESDEERLEYGEPRWIYEVRIDLGFDEFKKGYLECEKALKSELEGKPKARLSLRIGGGERISFGYSLLISPK